MDSFIVHYKFEGENQQISRQSRVCLQVAKSSVYFKYYLNSYNNIPGLSKEESFNFVVEVVQNIIKEFEMDVTFNYSYKNKYFEFTQPNKNIELYICLLFSRFLYSNSYYYSNTTIQRMYLLKNKYTTFESFIIASCDSHYGYYSIVERYVLSLKKFRQLKTKKGFFKNLVNNNVANNLAFYLHPEKVIFGPAIDNYNLCKDNNDIEKYYFDLVEKVKQEHTNKILYKINDRLPNLKLYNLNYSIALELNKQFFRSVSERNNRYSDATFIDKEELISLLPLIKTGKVSKSSKLYKLLQTHNNYIDNE